MKGRILIFDASALIFAQPIITNVQREYEIRISPLISVETGISDGVTVTALEPSDADFVYDILMRNFGKNHAITYKKGRKLKHAGEAEALALARRFNAPVVLHEKGPHVWARIYKIECIKLVDLPEKLALSLPTI